MGAWLAQGARHVTLGLRWEEEEEEEGKRGEGRRHVLKF